MTREETKRLREEIVESIARSLYVQAYADFIEEQAQGTGEPERDEDVSDLPQAPRDAQDWFDVAPSTTTEARTTARKAVASIEKLNGRRVTTLYRQATQACCGSSRCVHSRHNPDQFGHYLGMMLTGSGVSWFDDHARFPIKVPDVRLYIMCRADVTSGIVGEVDERFAREAR